MSQTGLSSFLLLAVLGGAARDVASAAEPKSPPHIILILADDLGYADLGSYGNKHVATPHLDRLAAEGTRFTDFHANAPMCTPARAALLTGRYQQRSGMDIVGNVISNDEVMIPARLKEAGYATAIFGKWHLAGHLRADEFYRDHLPTRFGFDEFRGFMGGCLDYMGHLVDNGTPDWWHNNEQVQEEGHASRLLVDHAIHFMCENREHPMFVYLALPDIHFPWMTANDPPYYQRGQTYPRAGDPKRSRLGPHDGSPMLKSVVRRMIEEMDTAVGRVSGALKDLGIADNTLIFFTSDNGGYVGYRQWDVETKRFLDTGVLNNGMISDNGPLRGQKAEVYEGGHRVPAIAWWPGHIPAGAKTDELTMTFDVFPTFLDVVGLDAPSDESSNALDGKSLLPLLLKQQPLQPRLLYWLFQDRGAIRDGHWKLVSQEGGPIELYNLADDIGESRNLSQSRPEIAARLNGKLAEFRKSVNESPAVSVRHPIKSKSLPGKHRILGNSSGGLDEPSPAQADDCRPAAVGFRGDSKSRNP